MKKQKEYSECNILFVCLGNICRSPMAEAVLRDRIKKIPEYTEILVDSAGTAGYHIGEKPHEGTCRILKSHGIGYDGILGRKISKEDFNRFHMIIAMDESNYKDLQRIAPSDAAIEKIYLLSDFVENAPWRSVPDPWYTKRFDETYRLVCEGCDGIIEWLSN